MNASSIKSIACFLFFLFSTSHSRAVANYQDPTDIINTDNADCPFLRYIDQNKNEKNKHNLQTFYQVKIALNDNPLQLASDQFIRALILDYISLNARQDYSSLTIKQLKFIIEQQDYFDPNSILIFRFQFFDKDEVFSIYLRELWQDHSEHLRLLLEEIIYSFSKALRKKIKHDVFNSKIDQNVLEFYEQISKIESLNQDLKIQIKSYYDTLLTRQNHLDWYWKYGIGKFIYLPWIELSEIEEKHLKLLNRIKNQPDIMEHMFDMKNQYGDSFQEYTKKSRQSLFLDKKMPRQSSIGSTLSHDQLLDFLLKHFEQAQHIE